VIRQATAMWRLGLASILFTFFAAVGATCVHAQPTPVERTFPVSKSTVESALKKLQPSMSGHLPTLDGFAQPAEHPLGRYQRGFYQCTIQVSSTSSGGSVVKVSAKVTAWYADPNSSHSGYQLLTSNGRLEGDLLDQLADQLSTGSAGSEERLPVVASQPSSTNSPADEPSISAPEPGSATTAKFSPSLSAGPSAPAPAAKNAGDSKPSAKEGDLQAETASLEEVLKNQARPRNIVAVRKSGTPVVGSPSLGGKTLFLASAHDEFEMLDFNDDWVHVRISGLSRGWIWRTSVEMPEGIPDVPRTDRTMSTSADLFQVSREETAPFPGDWAPLRGKTVKIVSVQKVQENEKDSGAQAKLAFAKTILDKDYDELSRSAGLSGIVLIFDSADGGMIAATLNTIQRWKAGALNDAAMWHQCYFDPPETFTISSASASPSP
jgi:hypothetical protein